MTKKDYELVARVFERNWFIAPTKELQTIVNMATKLYCTKVADALQAENPKFNRQKFLLACGVVDTIVVDNCPRCRKHTEKLGHWCNKCKEVLSQIIK